MSHIFAIANTKGGVGKSTLAVNLAVLAAEKGYKVLLVDADPQASSMQFLNAREDGRPTFQGIQLAQPILHKQLPELSKPFDYVFIDVGGRDAPVFRSALVSADTILVPMVPSAFDTWAVADVFKVLDELSSVNELDARIVLNSVTPTIIAREALESLEEELTMHGVSVMDTVIQKRTAWPHAIGEALGVGEFEPSGKAAQELYQLARELGIYGEEETIKKE